MKRTTGFFYASTHDGPWTHVEPACVSLSPEDVWFEHPIVMMDVETTGLDWTRDEITEIAFVAGKLVRDDEHLVVAVDSIYHSLVRPRDMEAAERTTSVTGITVDMLRGAPTFAEMAEGIAAFLGSYERDRALLAAYNARFDQPFVAAEFLRCAVPVPTMLGAHASILDPYTWVRKIDKYASGAGRHKLTAAAIRHDVIDEETAASAHRADFDAELALRLLATIGLRVPVDLQDLLDYQRASTVEWSEDFFGNYLPKRRRADRIERARALAVDESVHSAHDVSTS